MMPRLKDELRSECRPGYVYPTGSPVILHELLDEERLIWLAELALPKPELVGGFEYEVLEVPGTSVEFKDVVTEPLPSPTAEALRAVRSWLGDDVRVTLKERKSPRTLQDAA